MLTLSPAASEALAVVLAELNAAAKFRRGAVTVTLFADVEVIDGTLEPLVCGAEFEGCRPFLPAGTHIDPDQDGKSYAYFNGEFQFVFPD